jgi:TonB-linked SusC/RagA family outer membrane protein
MKRFLLVCLTAVLTFSASAAWAQDRTVSGTVTSVEDGSTLPGVNVLLKGTTTGTSTDSEGKYSLSVPSTGGTLVFSFIGIETTEVVIGERTLIDVALKQDVTQLSEIVVVGYGEQSSRNTTSAVATINSESFRNVPAITPQQLIQGQAAGVQMVNSSGVLGAASTIRIRGAASITGGGSPLYVVDNVPLNDGANGAFSTAQGAGSGLNPLLDLNPNDIESISVLKDAAAIAIYGSRGANGVILIKTKRGGKGQKTKINLDYYTGTTKPTAVLSYMQPEEYKTFTNEYRVARGQAPTVFPDGGFDWVKGVLRTGKINSYNLSATGGDEKTTFFVGAGIYKESGFTIGNDLKRLSGRINLEHKISDKVKFGVNYALSNTTSDRIGAENSTFAPLTSSYLQTPSVQPRDASGNYVNTGFIANVLAIEELNDNKFKFKRQTGNIYGQWDIIDGLFVRSEFGIDLVQSEEKSRVVNVVTPGGTASRVIIQDNKWLTTNTLNYIKDFGENHSFSALIGHSFETAVNDDITVAGSGFVSDNLRNVNSASTKTTTDETGTAWALESFIGRLNYRLKNRYIFEVSGRRDGSSRFGQNKKYGTFYAVSGGWILTEESFLSNVKFLDLLKLTASYGTSGNDRIGNFGWAGLYAGGVGSDYAGSPGLAPSQVNNPELGWESTSQLDIGISTSLFNSRVSLDVNYYKKTTTDLLAAVPLPFTTGFPSVNKNVGEMENRGWDIMLNTVNVDAAGFKWTTSFNIGLLKNEVISLPTNKDAEGRDFLAGSTAQRAIVGESMNTFYVIRYKGVNPQTGEAEWYNRNGEATISPVANDRVVVGSAIPDFTGGFTNTFTYKGFDLTAFFNFSYGNKVLIDGLRFTENMGGTFNKSTDLLNYWKQPGDNAFAPRLDGTTAGAGVFNQLSDYQVLDGSYARLKNLTLGYSAPKSLLDKTKVLQSLRVYVMAQNLWTIMDKDFRGPDPEVSANGVNNQILGESFFALPQAKSITFGVNIGL